MFQGIDAHVPRESSRELLDVPGFDIHELNIAVSQLHRTVAYVYRGLHFYTVARKAMIFNSSYKRFLQSFRFNFSYFSDFSSIAYGMANMTTIVSALRAM